MVYCSDAFAGLKAVQQFEAGRLTATEYDSATAVKPMKPGVKVLEIDRSNPVPKPPFWGQRYVEQLDPAELFPLINVV